jgi:hypothetical protein
MTASSHYGTDPQDLNQTAKSPIRLNQGHPNTIFRVTAPGRIDNHPAQAQLMLRCGIRSELKEK